jgi:hypothetical protein
MLTSGIRAATVQSKSKFSSCSAQPTVLAALRVGPSDRPMQTWDECVQDLCHNSSFMRSSRLLRILGQLLFAARLGKMVRAIAFQHTIERG